MTAWVNDPIITVYCLTPEYFTLYITSPPRDTHVLTLDCLETTTVLDYYTQQSVVEKTLRNTNVIRYTCGALSITKILASQSKSNKKTSLPFFGLQQSNPVSQTHGQRTEAPTSNPDLQ